MRLVIAAFAYSLFLGNAGAADPHWIRIQSPNFEIYSTASEATTRNTLKQFEQVRAFFVTTLPTKDEKPLPIRIVTFNSAKEYDPYRFNEFATAYYLSGAERDTIVMSHGGAENFPTAIHEYVHLVLQHAGVQAPPWLNEGLAEFYSTLHQVGNKVVIGEIIPGRLDALRHDKWVPLSVILAADRDSPYYNEKNKAGSFYNEAWALTHMLSLSEMYRPRWNQFVAGILQGKESVDALTTAYGKPLAAIEMDLQYYLRGDRFLAGSFDTKLEKINQQYSPEPPPPFDVRLMLLELTSRPGKETDTKDQLDKLSEEEPARPEPYVQLGYLAWQRNNNAEAQKLFEKAFSLGGRSARMLWDYGRMIEVSHPADAVRVLTELATIEPSRRDVQIELAAALLNANQPAQSVQTILALKGCKPDEAVRCVSLATFAYLKLNDRENAASTAQLYAKTAKTPEDRQRAQQILDFLKQPTGAVSRSVPQQTSGEPDGAPKLARSNIVDAPAQLVAALSVAGSFVDLVCDDALKVVIQTSSGKKMFVIEDPNNIVVTGRAEGKADLLCGQQKPVTVTVDYKTPAPSGSDGAVRAIHFEQ